MTTTDDSSADAIAALYVDDDPQLPELVSTQLERIDDRISVRTANRAEDALERVREIAVDCIVSDYQMPGTDGLEFLEAVRADYPSLPFILFTGKGSEDIAATAINNGVDAYVQKKLGNGQYSILANHITSLVEKHRTEKRLAWIERNIHLPDAATERGADEPATSPEPSVSMRVIRNVAEVDDVDPVELPPLYEVVDADLLDGLVASTPDRADAPSLSVTFEYCGYTVTIDGTREVSIEKRVRQ